MTNPNDSPTQPAPARRKSVLTAARACRPLADFSTTDRVPRAAWIEAQRGNLPQAIARARAALAEHPDFYSGWQLLSDWYLRTEQADDAVQAAETMARHRSDGAVSVHHTNAVIGAVRNEQIAKGVHRDAPWARKKGIGR